MTAMKEKIVFFVLLSVMVAWCGRDGTRLHAQTKVAPEQLRAPTVMVMKCAGVPPGQQSCDGLFYLEVTTSAGTPVKLVGTSTLPPFALDPRFWSVVP